MDTLNFGSKDRDTMIVLGGGVRYQFNDNLQIGLGGEKPITDEDKTIMDCRLYFDLVLSY